MHFEKVTSSVSLPTTVAQAALCPDRARAAQPASLLLLLALPDQVHAASVTVSGPFRDSSPRYVLTVIAS